MGSNATFAASSIKIGTTVLTGIESQGGSMNTQVMDDPDSGEIAPREMFITAQNPMARFSTAEVLAALQAVLTAEVGGKDLSAANLLMYSRKRQSGAAFASTGHDSRKISRGIIVPRTLRIPHQGKSVIDLEATAEADPASPTTDPIVYGSESPPAGSGSIDRFTLGATTIGGVAMPQKTDVQLDFGIEVISEGWDSECWPLIVCIGKWAPVIRVTTNDAVVSGLRTSLGAQGAVSVALREYQTGGNLIAGFALTGAASIAYPGEFYNASREGSQTSTFECRLYKTGSNDPIVLVA